MGPGTGPLPSCGSLKLPRQSRPVSPVGGSPDALTPRQVGNDRETSGRVFGRWLSGPGMFPTRSRKGSPPMAHLLCARKALAVNPGYLTLEQSLQAAASAGLLVVRTFCWCWRQRCQRKTTLAVLDKLGRCTSPGSRLPGRLR